MSENKEIISGNQLADIGKKDGWMAIHIPHGSISIDHNPIDWINSTLASIKRKMRLTIDAEPVDDILSRFYYCKPENFEKDDEVEVLILVRGKNSAGK